MTNEEAILHMILRREELKFSFGDIDKDIKVFNMAIKALEQTELNPSYNSVKTELDAISREALKDLGAECIAKRDENGNLIPLGSIDSLPSVSTEKTGRWIPVSERLPDIDEEVLVDDGIDRFVAWWVDDGYETRWHSFDESYKSDTAILAWMPLPQPYKGESEE